MEGSILNNNEDPQRSEGMGYMLLSSASFWLGAVAHVVAKVRGSILSHNDRRSFGPLSVEKHERRRDVHFTQLVISSLLFIAGNGLAAGGDYLVRRHDGNTEQKDTRRPLVRPFGWILKLNGEFMKGFGLSGIPIQGGSTVFHHLLRRRANR